LTGEKNIDPDQERLFFLIKETISPYIVEKWTSKRSSETPISSTGSVTDISAHLQASPYQKIRVIGQGEMFAEVVLFEQENYPVSAVALEESLVLMLPRRQVHCLLTEEQFRNAFITILMRKQRHLTERILNLTLHDAEERFFLFLMEQYGPREEYDIPLSKKDIAGAIWTNPETFSRLIQRLKQNGTIVWEQKKLRLRKGFWEARERSKT
jgi:CRP-like cAMP-binding protein